MDRPTKIICFNELSDSITRTKEYNRLINTVYVNRNSAYDALSEFCRKINYNKQEVKEHHFAVVDENFNDFDDFEKDYNAYHG